MGSPNPDELKQVYVLVGEEQTGPFAIEQIRGLWNQAAITSDAYYWHAGLENWEPLVTLMTESNPADHVEENSEFTATLVSDKKGSGSGHTANAKESTGQTKKDRKRARKAMVAAVASKTGQSGKSESSRVAASKASQGDRRSSHLPYCSRCRSHVNPSVVSRNRGGPGAAFAVGDGYVFAQRSTSELIKICPKCGERVYTTQELDEFVQRHANDEVWVWVIIGIVVVFSIICAAIWLSVALEDGAL
jgi:hypothetical protein